MPNRRITQFPAILPGDINDLDLLTLVHVFEIDPALRNKKITFSDFREYLDNYYVNINELDPLIIGNVIVSGDLVVSGESLFQSGVQFSGDVAIKEDLTVSGDTNISGVLVVQSGITSESLETTTINTETIEAISGYFVMATGVTLDFSQGYFDNLSGTTVTGDFVSIGSGTISQLTVTEFIHATSGDFDSLTVDNLIASGTVVISGEVDISGTLDLTDLNVTNTISGNTITGNVGRFETITGIDAVFTNLSGETVQADSLTWDVATGNYLDLGSGDFDNIVVGGIHAQTITGITIQASGLEVANDVTITGNLSVTGDFTVDDITVDHITANSGNFIELSGQTITGDTGLFNQIDVVLLNAVGLEFSGDQTISGSLTVVNDLVVSGDSDFEGDVIIASGLTVSGLISGTVINAQSGNFDVEVLAPTIYASTGDFDNVFIQNQLNVTGDTSLEGTLNVTGDTTVGNLDVTGNQTLSGNLTGDGGSITNFQYLQVESGQFNYIHVSGDVIITGDLNVSGTATFDELAINSGLIVSGDLLVSGSLTVDDDAVISGNITAVTGIYTTVTGTTANFTSGNFQTITVINDAVISGDLTADNITGVTSITSPNGYFNTVTGTLISGATVTGNLGAFGVGVFRDLAVTNALTISGNILTSGNITANNITARDDLVVSGSSTLHSGLVVQSGQAAFPWGTQAEPGITWTGDLNTGFYNPSGEMMTAVCDGNQAFTIESGTGPSEGRFVLTIWAAP